MNTYRDTIREILAKIGRLGMDPRHVEAYMRLEHGTLDALSPSAFRREVKISAECVIEGGVEAAEELAQSYGMMGEEVGRE